jgi:hypothetical protein
MLLMFCPNFRGENATYSESAGGVNVSILARLLRPTCCKRTHARKPNLCDGCGALPRFPAWLHASSKIPISYIPRRVMTAIQVTFQPRKSSKPRSAPMIPGAARTNAITSSFQVRCRAAGPAAETQQVMVMAAGSALAKATARQALPPYRSTESQRAPRPTQRHAKG